MGSAVKFWEDFSAADLRRLAKWSKDANKSGRLLSLAAVREGRDRSEAARMGNLVFETNDDIIDAACEAWNKLIALPDAIPSMRDWAHVGQM